MGMDLYIHVTTYIELFEVEQLVKTATYRCSNTACQNHKYMSNSNKFCPICGKEGETDIKEVMENQMLNWYDFLEENDLPDNLYQANDSNCVLPNISMKHSFSMSRHDDSMNCEISPQYIKNGIAEFKEKFQIYLDKIKEIYGKEVEIKFGVVSYYA